MRWHYRDPLLVWLLPLSYLTHIVEEWAGGFPEWIARVAGSSLDRGPFIVINAIALTVMIAATRATTRGESNGWMGIAIATVLFVNALLHILGSVLTRSYSPGLFTGVVLYLPICQLVLMRAWAQAERLQFVRGVVAGLLAHAAVVAAAYGVIAFTPSRGPTGIEPA